METRGHLFLKAENLPNKSCRSAPFQRLTLFYGQNGFKLVLLVYEFQFCTGLIYHTNVSLLAIKGERVFS